MFTEQRLSGCNPMVLRRVTEDSCKFNLCPEKWRGVLGLG